jgi:hypothetical protein
VRDFESAITLFLMATEFKKLPSEIATTMMEDYHPYERLMFDRAIMTLGLETRRLEQAKANTSPQDSTEYQDSDDPDTPAGILGPHGFRIFRTLTVLEDDDEYDPYEPVKLAERPLFAKPG